MCCVVEVEVGGMGPSLVIGLDTILPSPDIVWWMAYKGRVGGGAYIYCAMGVQYSIAIG